MNRISSSRKIETESKRNIELMWLTNRLSPDHGTISSFMKDNKEAIKQLFKKFTLMLKGFGLIDGQLDKMISKTREVFTNQDITVVADTVYYNMQEIISASNNSTEILIKKQKGNKNKVKNGFDKADFNYRLGE